MVYGPPEESDERQAQVTTLVNNLRNTEGDIETGPCGEHWPYHSQPFKPWNQPVDSPHCSPCFYCSVWENLFKW